MCRRVLVVPKRSIRILLGALVLYGIGLSVAEAMMCHSVKEVCAETASAVKGASVKSETKTQPVEVKNEYCPVMGEKIAKGKEVKYTYKGKIYNFCCPDCIKQFKKDPKKYIKKIEESKKKEGEYHQHSH